MAGWSVRGTLALILLLGVVPYALGYVVPHVFPDAPPPLPIPGEVPGSFLPRALPGGIMVHPPGPPPQFQPYEVQYRSINPYSYSNHPFAIDPPPSLGGPRALCPNSYPPPIFHFVAPQGKEARGFQFDSNKVYTPPQHKASSKKPRRRRRGLRIPRAKKSTKAKSTPTKTTPKTPAIPKAPVTPKTPAASKAPWSLVEKVVDAVTKGEVGPPSWPMSHPLHPVSFHPSPYIYHPVAFYGHPHRLYHPSYSYYYPHPHYYYYPAPPVPLLFLQSGPVGPDMGGAEPHEEGCQADEGVDLSSESFDNPGYYYDGFYVPSWDDEGRHDENRCMRELYNRSLTTGQLEYDLGPPAGRGLEANIEGPSLVNPEPPFQCETGEEGNELMVANTEA